MELRLADLSEYQDVAACMAAFRDFLGDSEPSTGQLIEGARHVMSNELAEFVVAGTPAHSYVQLRYIWSAWHNTEICWVEDVFVADHQRGKGVGWALMDFVSEHAAGRGCKRLQLDANEANAPGVALYEKAGFTNSNDWWGGGRDLFWVKQL